MFTRRQFVATTAGFLAGAGSNAAPQAPLFSFALVTDTHLGKPGADYVQRMRDAVAEINASPAEFTVFCGDLVDHGEVDGNEKRYGEWSDIARDLRKDYTAVPGNHDPVARFTRHIRPQTDSVLDYKGYRLLCFADAEPNPGHLGVVTEHQLKWLQDRLSEARKKDQRVILAAHVIYHANQHPDVGWYIKEKAIREAFGKLLAANRHVVAFFAGHAHCGLRG
jgi:3',5'-cyclic AMP phosphodiesterase CpdA